MASVAPGSGVDDEEATMHPFWLTFKSKVLEEEYFLTKTAEMVEAKFMFTETRNELAVNIFNVILNGILSYVFRENESVHQLFVLFLFLNAFVISYNGTIQILIRYANFESIEFQDKYRTIIPLAHDLALFAQLTATIFILHSDLIQKFECDGDGECSTAAQDCSIPLEDFGNSSGFTVDLRGTFHHHFAKWYYLAYPIILGFNILFSMTRKKTVFQAFLLGCLQFGTLMGVGLSYATQPIDYAFVPFMNVMSVNIIAQVIQAYDKTQRMNFLLSRKQQKKLVVQHFELRRKSADIRTKDKVIADTKMKLADAQLVVTDVMGGAVLRQYAIAYENLTFGKAIGEGSFGTVMKGLLRGTTTVAIKTMPVVKRVGKVTHTVMTKFKSEIIVMAPLKHPNLVHLYGAVWGEGPDKLCLVIEYVEKGTISNILKPTSRLSWATRFNIAFGVAKCFRYLHHELPEPLIHRDLKPDNVLADINMEPKVADFGESKRWEKKMDPSGRGAVAERELLTQTLVGTALYMASQSNNNRETFAYALTLLEIAVGDASLVSKSTFNSNMYYVHGNRPVIPEWLAEGHPEIVKIIKMGWNQKPLLRPEFTYIVKMLERIKPGDDCILRQPSSKRQDQNALISLNDEDAMNRFFRDSPKKFTAFLSHHKAACATEARLIKDKLDTMLAKEAFLDSDNLRDLRTVLHQVCDSDVLVLFQSKEVLQRPWCLLELYTAITKGIPIVAINCVGKEYDFPEAAEFLLHLETNLKTVNAGALNVLAENGVNPVRLAHALSTVLPNIISLSLNTSASENAIKAFMADLAKSMYGAQALPLPGGFEKWVEARSEQELAELEAVIERGTISRGETIRGTVRGRMLQKLEHFDEMKLRLEESKVREAEAKAHAKEREAQLLEREDQFLAQLEKKDTRIEKLETKIEKLEERLFKE